METSSSSATLKELTSALHDTLKYNGVLSKLQALARSEIHACLQAEELPPPTLPNENLIINELILEYLKFNGYGHTASVMRAETGQPVEGSVEPSFIRSELGVKGGSKIPVLYGVVEALKTNKENNGKDLVAARAIADARREAMVGGDEEGSEMTGYSDYTGDFEQAGQKPEQTEGGMPQPVVFSNF